MSSPNIYLERYAWPTREFPEFIPHRDLELIVVIPAYNEREILKAMKSLNQCTNAENVLILVIINESKEDSERIWANNKQTLFDLQFEAYQIPIHAKIIRLPSKKAGVGLARKIGMDEAVRIFEEINKDGILVCYDADCICDKNYLSSIKHYYKDPARKLGLVHYEHDLFGDNYSAIVKYELYLRYYIDSLRWAGFPFAFQTLGSCITVKSKAYQKQGGMNTRKAGEDFYFIHKMTPLGGIGEINTTTIHPSDRVSDRVPFGTGHAVQKYLDQEHDEYEVYNPRIFAELKHFLGKVEMLYTCSSYYEAGYSPKCTDFLEAQDFDSSFVKMKKNSSNLAGFIKLFFAWFDGFRVLKMVHFLRDTHYPNIDLVDALGWLNHEYAHIKPFGKALEEKLIALRDFDRNSEFYIK